MTDQTLLQKLYKKYGITEISPAELKRLKGDTETFEAFVQELSQLFGFEARAEQVDDQFIDEILVRARRSKTPRHCRKRK